MKDQTPDHHLVFDLYPVPSQFVQLIQENNIIREETHFKMLPIMVYFSCSITGGRQDQRIYSRIVDFLLGKGISVPTADLANPDILLEEKKITAEEVFSRDIQWVDECDAVIAEVSTPSHGVGFEIAYALARHKPVLCVFEKGKHVSKMLLGNHQYGFTIHPYSDFPECQQIIEQFLVDINQKVN